MRAEDRLFCMLLSIIGLENIHYMLIASRDSGKAKKHKKEEAEGNRDMRMSSDIKQLATPLFNKTEGEDSIQTSKLIRTLYERP